MRSEFCRRPLKLCFVDAGGFLQRPEAVNKDMDIESEFPPGWDEKRVEEVLSHYESQTDEEAAAEHDAAVAARLCESKEHDDQA